MDIKIFREKEFARREARLDSAFPQELIKTDKLKENLHIVYVMTWTDLCGGSKIILEHANRLTERGQKVTLISHFNKPTWYEMDERIEFIQVPFENVLCESIPECDLIVATYWREIYEAIEQNIAPVLYFEQGDAHLFDPDSLDYRTTNYIKKQFDVVPFIFTVSNYAREIIKNKFNKDATVIPNAIDDRYFFYQKKADNDFITIALIGSLDTEFKGIKYILSAIDILNSEGYKIKVNWVSPTVVSDSKYNAIISPKQMIIGNLLRESDIYICASQYESFCLPVLEAMSCGTSVITTDNGGVRDYVIDKDNALIIKKNNVDDIVEKVKLLISDKKLRLKLSLNGSSTSKAFNWDNTINLLLDYYKEVASYEVVK